MDPSQGLGPTHPSLEGDRAWMVQDSSKPGLGSTSTLILRHAEYAVERRRTRWVHQSVVLQCHSTLQVHQ